MYQVRQRYSLPPSCPLKIGGCWKFPNVSHAQVGHRYDWIRQSENTRELFRVQNADPPDADSFRPRGKPQVLNRAAGAVQIGFENRTASEHVWTAAAAVTGHAKIESGFENPLQLQRQEELLPFRVIEFGRAIAFALEAVEHGLPRLAIFDHDEIPWLHKADGPGSMRRR